VSWIVFVYRLPAQPSRHRVGVWRELRRIGALPIQQSIYILPDDRTNLDALARVASVVEAAEGESYLLRAEAVDEATRSRLEAAQLQAVEEEYQEFLSESSKFRQEIRKEIRIQKFTRAELAEEEHSFERLERWAVELAGTDRYGAPSRSLAELALKECGEALEDFASRVLAAEERP
jgi:hypothetical protein